MVKFETDEEKMRNNESNEVMILNSVSDDVDKLSEDFFMNSNRFDSKKDDISESTKFNQNFSMNEKNINFDKPHNIKMTIGAELFNNILDFLNEINYDIIFRIFKNRLRLYTVDVGQVYRAHVEFKSNEFAEFNIKDSDKLDDDNEIDIYADLSIIKNMVISKDNPLDIYIDTVVGKKIYFVCGNDIQWRRLNSLREDDLVLRTFKNEEVSLHKLLNRDDYQKIVLTGSSTVRTIGSMSKKENKSKDSTSIINIIADTNKFGYVIEDELRGGEYWNRGNDIIVQPVDKCSVTLRLEYIKIFGNLKLDNQVKYYMNESLPLILETRTGGNGITIWYLIAPRLKNDDD